MIQRIQTLYLFLVAGLFLALLFFPLAAISAGDVSFSFNVFGLHSTTIPVTLAYPTWSLMAMDAIIILLSFFIIFSYKKRILQIRLCVYNELLMIGFCLLFGFYFWHFYKSPALPDIQIRLSFWSAFPIVAMILNYLAIRNIGADETMVRSLERLR